MSEFVQNETKVIRPCEQVGVYTKEQVVGILQKIRQEISHITDMEVVRGGLYVREFEVAEIIDKHIAEYTGEQA